MKVLHVITGLHRTAGGPARSSQGLVAAECALGVDAWICALDGSHPWMDGVRAWMGDWKTQLKEFDLVHIHGIWHLGLHRICVACRKQKVPYLIAPRGMLESWSLRQKWLKKRLARFLYQDRDLKLAVALHATAQSEADQFRRLGFRNKIVISPNGVNLPDDAYLNALRTKAAAMRQTPNRLHRALFVSRMHPKKGVRELIEAWAKVKQDGGLVNWCCELVYTLNGETECAYEHEVKALAQTRGVTNDFVFTGPLDDRAKWEAYARADLFVLPTYSENFGIVIAEALAMGLPVITTKGTPWQELEKQKCGWWIDVGVEALATSFREVMKCQMQGLLLSMGKQSLLLFQSRYTWEAAVSSVFSFDLSKSGNCKT